VQRIFLLLIVTIVSSVSFAGTGPVETSSQKINGVEICRAYALHKLANFDSKAIANMDSFRLISLDARVLNPSHYAWYEMEISVDGVTKTIQTRVQLNRITGNCI